MIKGLRRAEAVRIKMGLCASYLGTTRRANQRRMYLLGGLLLLVLDLLLQGLLLALGDERLLGSTLALVVLGTLTT